MSEKKSLYEKLSIMRTELLKKDIKKTGRNDFSKFDYYELSDFLPECTEIASENKTVFLYSLDKEEATLTLVNCENIEEKLFFQLPLAELNIKGANAIQNIGGLTTYTRRYLYMIAFEISEKDSFDPNENNEPSQKQKDIEAEKKALEEQKKIAQQKINETKLKVLKDKITAVGVSEQSICTRYELEKLEDTTEEVFVKILSALNATEKAKKASKG